MNSQTYNPSCTLLGENESQYVSPSILEQDTCDLAYSSINESNDCITDSSNKQCNENTNKTNCNKNKHYVTTQGIQAIDLIEAYGLNFNLGNAIKYIARCNYKGSKRDDLEKAIWYINRELKTM